MGDIRPFRFRLKKIPSEINDLVSGLLDYLPATEARESFHLAIRKALQQYLQEIRYYLKTVEPVSFGYLSRSLPSPCCVGVLGMEPFREKAFVEVDPALGFLMIEKLLGGKGEGALELRPLTETEQGVIEFLILKVLSEIHKRCGETARLHFRLEKMILEPAHIRDYAAGEAPYVCLKNHAALLGRSGFINIHLPHPWVLEGFLKDLPTRRKLSRAESEGPLKNFETLPVSLLGEIGSARVGAGELNRLEAGDVVLLDETSLAHAEGLFSGSVRLQAGEGEAGRLVANWRGFHDGGKVEITGFETGGRRDG